MIYEQSDFHKPCEIQFSDSNLTASRMISAWAKEQNFSKVIPENGTVSITAPSNAKETHHLVYTLCH